MLKLEYLICASRSFGQGTIRTRGGSHRLQPHDRLRCNVHVCRDYAEFAQLNADLIANKTFAGRHWTAVQVRDTETGKTFDPPPDLLASSNPPFSGAGAVVLAVVVGDVTAAVPPAASAPAPDLPLPPEPVPSACEPSAQGPTFGEPALPAPPAIPPPSSSLAKPVAGSSKTGGSKKKRAGVPALPSKEKPQK